MDETAVDDMIKEIDSDSKGFVDILEFAKLSFGIKEKTEVIDMVAFQQICAITKNNPPRIFQNNENNKKYHNIIDSDFLKVSCKNLVQMCNSVDIFQKMNGGVESF